MTAKEPYTFRDFILDQLRQRDMSARQFAIFADVDPSTITRAIDATNPARPGLDFLFKLSKATQISLGALTELAYPEMAQETELSPDAKILAQRIEQLPERKRELVLDILRGAG